MIEMTIIICYPMDFLIRSNFEDAFLFGNSLYRMMQFSPTAMKHTNAIEVTYKFVKTDVACGKIANYNLWEGAL